MLWRVPKLLLILQNLKQIEPVRITHYFAMPFYAVAKGRTAGIYMTWADCEAQVKGFSGARYKKFDSVTSAQEFINTEGAVGKKDIDSNKNFKQFTNTNFNGNNLKRSYSTSASQSQRKSYPAVSNSNKNKKKPEVRKAQIDTDDEESHSDSSDDLNTILVKQMDDIEKRLKGFEKGVDKIMKKGSSKGPGRKAIMIDPPQPKKRRDNKDTGFDESDDGFVRVYTDGACSSNGRAGARAGLGVYWGDGHALNMSEPVSGRATNNCGEIQAATQAIKAALQNGIYKLEINTDSKFLINSVTKWMPGWKRKGWKLKSGEPVKNEVDFKELDELQNKLQIKWNYVEAHRGIHGNEMADQLAKAGAAKYGYKN